MTVATLNLPSQYDPATAEAKWQQLWEANDIFKADPNHPGWTLSQSLSPLWVAL